MNTIPLSNKRASMLLRANKKILTEIERACSVKIQINSETTLEKSASITGESQGEWVAGQVLLAIELGFSSKDALLLTNDDFYLEQLDLEQSMRGNQRGVERQKARIIGTEGKAKKTLEDLSESKIAINDGPMLGIIGGFDEVSSAKEAILQLLEGKPHQSVFSYLEEQQRRREARRLGAKV